MNKQYKIFIISSVIIVGIIGGIITSLYCNINYNKMLANNSKQKFNNKNRTVKTNTVLITTDELISEHLDKMKLLRDEEINQIETAKQSKIDAENESKIEAAKKLKETQKQNNSSAIQTVKVISSQYSYKSDTLSINIEPISQTNPNIKAWLCHIVIKSPEQLKSSFANGGIGTRSKVSSITENNRGILGINASAFSFDTNMPIGIVIKNGHIYQGGVGSPMCIKNDGTIFSPDTNVDAQTLINEGVKDTFNFGPVLINNGQRTVISNGNPSSNYPRTVIGQISPTEYWILVVDGKRGDYSIGYTPNQLQDIMLSKGVKYAYNLDGGGSSSLCFNGSLMNNPSDPGGERPVVDAIYFTD